MKKLIVALLVITVLLSFAACGSKNKVLTQEEAIAVALKNANLKDYDDAHAHITTEDGAVCFSIHITVGETTYNYVIAAQGGEILSSGVEEE